MIIIEWINLIKYQMLDKNSYIIATLRWVRLVHKCQIVKFWKQIESIRAFMRECAWRYAPASVGIYVQVGPTSILVLQLYLCQYLILDFVNSINYNHLAHINVLYTARLSRLLRSKRHRGRHKQTVYRSFHMHSAVTCTAALATGTNRAVFSTSTVCQDALFIKHKYAQDDCNWMN